MMSHMWKAQRQQGFTLIELLVSIAIIALLSSIVFTNLSVSRKKARDIRRLSDFNSIFKALELYHNKYGNYPCSSGELSTSSSFLSALVTEGFLSKSAVDPSNTAPYVYYYSTFKTNAGGACGQIFQFNYDIEVAGTKCQQGGILLPVGSPTATHCHIFVPMPLPCSDPYLTTTETTSGGPCDPLRD